MHISEQRTRHLANPASMCPPPSPTIYSRLYHLQPFFKHIKHLLSVFAINPFQFFGLNSTLAVLGSHTQPSQLHSLSHGLNGGGPGGGTTLGGALSSVGPKITLFRSGGETAQTAKRKKNKIICHNQLLVSAAI